MHLQLDAPVGFECGCGQLPIAQQPAPTHITQQKQACLARSAEHLGCSRHPRHTAYMTGRPVPQQDGGARAPPRPPSYPGCADARKQVHVSWPKERESQKLGQAPALGHGGEEGRTGGVELHELQVLHGDARPHRHGVAIAGAGVRGGGAEVRPPVPPGRQDGLRAAGRHTEHYRGRPDTTHSAHAIQLFVTSLSDLEWGFTQKSSQDGMWRSESECTAIKKHCTCWHS